MTHGVNNLQRSNGNDSTQSFSSASGVTSSQSVSPETVAGVTAKKVKKTVTFCLTVNMVLIPCREEYREAKLLPKLYWQPVECKSFQDKYFTEIKEYAKGNNLPLEPPASLKIATRMYTEHFLAQLD